LLDAIGGYVDTASRHEFRDALQAHRTGPVIERVMAADGSVISHRSDWVAYVDAPGFFASEVAEGRFILSGHSENIRWKPSVHRNEVRPENTHGDLELPDERLERCGGAFASRRPDVSSVWIVLWTSVLPETDSGDLAPRFGGFEAELEEPEDDDS